MSTNIIANSFQEFSVFLEEFHGRNPVALVVDVLRTFCFDLDPSKLACDQDLVNDVLNLKGGCNGTPQEVTAAVRRTERLQLRRYPLLHPRSNNFKIQILVQNGKPRNASLELRVWRAEQPPKVPEASDRKTRMKVDRCRVSHRWNYIISCCSRQRQGSSPSAQAGIARAA